MKERNDSNEFERISHLFLKDITSVSRNIVLYPVDILFFIYIENGWKLKSQFNNDCDRKI